MRILRALLAVTFGFLLLAAPGGQQPNTSVIGWYNGAWQSGIPGLNNWYEAPDNYSRVYDEFEVPAGGWTVTGVFSDNALYDFPAVGFASWEIRRGMSPGRGGQVVATGISPATQKPDPSVTAPPYPASEPAKHFRIQVDGLNVKLPAGRYWLSVAPMGKGQSVLSATLGTRAVGANPNRLGRALYRHVSDEVSPYAAIRRAAKSFVAAKDVGSPGQFGKAQHFSQGVLIAK